MKATESIDRAASAGPFRSKDVLILGAWFGLVAGLVEGVSFWVFNAADWLTWKTRLESVDHNIVWASSLVDVLFFLAVACFLIPAFRLFRLRQQQLFATAIFATMAFYAFLGVSGRLRERGAIMLALGLGVVVSRRMGRNPQRARAFLRRSLVWVAIIVLVASLGVVAGGAVWEKVQLARLPAAPSGAPNVLLIVLDTLRADRLGSYGYQRPTTPFLDDFARDAVRFEKAFANSSWSLPSHISLFTGRLPYEHGATLNPYDGRFPTLAQVLASQGYVTVGFVSNTYFVTRAHGADRGFLRWENIFTGPLDSARRTVYGRRFVKYFKYIFQHYVPYGEMPAEEISHRFLNWLDKRPERPFFAFLNFMELHQPYTPPREVAARFSPHPEKLSPRLRWRFGSRKEQQKGPEQVRLESDGYDASLAYLDAQVKLLFDELRSRGLEENTLVIITSDHGQSLGERDLFGHRNSLYLEQIRVPLLIRLPGTTPAGSVVAAVVGLHMLPATVVDLVGMERRAFPGPSLAALWSGEASETAPVLSEVVGSEVPWLDKGTPIEQGWIKSLVTSRWHFLLQQDGKVELYNWAHDPQELRNLADTAVGQSIAAKFRGRLENLISARSNLPERSELEGADD